MQIADHFHQTGCCEGKRSDLAPAGFMPLDPRVIHIIVIVTDQLKSNVNHKDCLDALHHGI